jgi:hypothetical protein
MIPKKPAPDAIRGGYRFSEKIMLQQYQRRGPNLSRQLGSAPGKGRAVAS